MPVDVFDREVKASIEELRAALAGDVAQTKKDRKEKDENTDQLKKLNDNLEKLVGSQLDKELKALNKLIKKVADCCEDAKNRKSSSDAKAIGKAVAKSLGVGSGTARALEKSIEDMMEPAFDVLTDKTMTFGKVLERSQRRFGVAFGMIGKQFQKDFGSLFSGWRKSNEKSATESVGYFRKGWEDATAFIRETWNKFTTSIKETVSSAWDAVTKTVSTAWNAVTNKVTEKFGKAVEKIKTSWAKYGQPIVNTLTAPFRMLGKGFKATTDKIYQYIDPLGKAASGTVKDLSKMGQTVADTSTDFRKAGRGMDDLTGEGVIKGGDDDGGGKGGKGGKGRGGDLCRCICRCMYELIGVTKDGDKKTTKWLENMFKGDKKRDTANAKGGKNSTAEAIAAALKKKEGGAESQATLMREWMQDRRRENWQRRGAGMRQKALGATSAASRFVFGEKPMESLLAGVAAGTAKVTGKIVEGPISLIGDLIEKSTIPGLTALGPVIKAFGGALGGLAEGLVNFVLTPLIEQVEMMDDATKAMYVSTGATQAAPRVSMAGKPPPGQEWSDITKRVVESNTNMDSTARTLEKLGTYMNDVAETGQRFTVIQKTMLRNFKRGIQDTKTLNKVTKTGLQTAYLLNASADSTADLFADWHQRLGMSTTDLRGMQRNMTQIARSTGIVGDELVQVAKSSQQFMESMRMAGNLTTTSAKNIIELTARARKTGTEGATGRILDMLSKGILRGGGGPKEHALATIGSGGRADLAQHALQGTLLETDEGMKDFATNLENWTRKLIGADPSKSLEANIKKLTPAARARYTAIMEQTVGVGLNEMAIVVDNLKETTKSFSERIADFSKAARGPVMSFENLQGLMDKSGGEWRKTFDNLVKEKGSVDKAIDEMLNMEKLPDALRKTLEGQLSAQQADFQKQQLFIKTSSDLLDEFNKSIADGDKGFDKAIADLGNNKNFREYFKAIGTDAAAGGEAIQKALADQAERIRVESKKLGKEEIAKMLPSPEEIQKALAGKDTKRLEEITGRFTRAQGILATQGMKSVNPIETLKQDVHLIEGYFKELVMTGIFQALPFLTEAILQLKNAEFWDAFREGNVQKGIELLGEFLGNMGGNIEKAMGQVANLQSSKGFQKFIAGVVSGIATIAKPLLEAIGNYIKDNASEFTKFIEDMGKLLKETNWNDIGKAIGMIVGALSILGTLLAVGGVLALGIATLIGPLGLGGLVAILGGGALAYGIYELAKALKDLDKAKADLNKTVQKEIEFNQKKTEKQITTNKEDALAGNTSVLEARRAALLREEQTIMERIEKNKDKKAGAFGSNAEEVAQLAADRVRKNQIDSEKKALEEQLKISKAREAENAKNLVGKDLASKQMDDYWNNAKKKQIEGKALQDKLIKEGNVSQARDLQKNLWTPFQVNAQKVYDSQWANSLSGGLTEGKEEKYVRQRYGVGVVQQRQLGIKDRDQLGTNYSQLADILWKEGPEKAMAYINQNAKKLNMDIVQSMLEVYGSKLPVEMAKNLKTSFSSADYNKLNQSALTAKLGEVTPEQFLKARELSRKRGVEAPEISDLSSVLSNPNAVKLSKEQLEFLQRSNEVLKEQIEITKQRRDAATDPAGKSQLTSQVKNLETSLQNFLSEGVKKQIAEMEQGKIVGPQAQAIEKMGKMGEDATDVGSIYTHDVHLEKLLENIFPGSIRAVPAASSATTVNPMLPGSSQDAEAQVRKEKAEMSQEGSDMSVVEGNTGTTAAAARAQVKLLSKIGKLLAKAIAGGGLAGLAGPDFPTEEFMEDILSTEWPGARPGRTVGLEIGYTDIA